jgi:hypothetical protein
MADRKVNGKRIYSKGWTSTTRDVFHYCLEVAADSMGILAETPAGIAETLTQEEEPITAEMVKAALDILIDPQNPTLLRYKVNGKSYLIFVNWQDNQKIHYDYRPEYPCPPASVLIKLSKKTQELIIKHYELSQEYTKMQSQVSDELVTTNSQLSDELVRGTVSVSVSVTDSVNKKIVGKKPADIPPGCGWCLRPKENPSDEQKLILYHHQQFKQRFDDCPDSSKAVGRNTKDLTRLLKGHTPPGIEEVICHALDSEEPWLKKKGYELSVILDNFDAIRLAKKKGEPYGTDNRTKQPLRRHNAAAPEAFGPSGEVKF